MQIESGFGQSPELGQTHFCNAPEVFNAVDMGCFICELILAMLHAVMFFVSQVHQTVIAFPSIGMDGAFEIHLAPDHRLKRGSRAVRDYFCVHFAVAFCFPSAESGTFELKS